MFRHARAVNKLQLGLYGSNRGLKATGDMFSTCDEEAKHTVMGSMGMALTIRRVARLSHACHKLLLLGLSSGLLLTQARDVTVCLGSRHHQEGMILLA